MVYNFSNKSLNKLHLNYGLVRFGQQFIELFGIIVLYKLGYPLWLVFIFYGLFSLGEFIFRFFVFKKLSQFGLRKTTLIGAFFLVLSVPVFYLSTFGFFPVWGYFLFSSFASAFYWFPFGIVYGLVGDQESRGKQAAVKEGYAKIAYGLGPLASGIVYHYFGPSGLFFCSTIIFFLAMYVLNLVKKFPDIDLNVGIKKGLAETSKNGFVLKMLFAFNDVFSSVVWGVVLFFLFKEDTIKTGWVLSIIMLIGVIIEYGIGDGIDSRKKIKRYYFGAIIVVFSIISRTFFGFSSNLVILFDSILMLGYALLSPYESVFIYNSIQDSKYPQVFTMLEEAGRDLGYTLSSFLISFLLFYGFELRYIIPIGLVVIPFIILFFDKYFSFSSD